MSSGGLVSCDISKRDFLCCMLVPIIPIVILCVAIFGSGVSVEVVSGRFEAVHFGGNLLLLSLLMGDSR